jgi:hypothetical protein
LRFGTQVFAHASRGASARERLALLGAVIAVVLVVREEARLAELAEAVVEHRGRDALAARLHLAERAGLRAQLPQHPQGPAAAEELEEPVDGLARGEEAEGDGSESAHAMENVA